MAKSQNAESPIQPDLTYTTDQLARIFGVGAITLERNYIFTGKWLHTCLFKGVYAVPGWVVIREIEKDLTTWGTEEPDESESRSSAPAATETSSSAGKRRRGSGDSK